MFAFEIPNLRFSLPAIGTVERYRFVSAYTGGAVKHDGRSGAIGVIGVSMNHAEDGQVLEIADGLVIVEAAELIEDGMYVTPNTDGCAIEAVGDSVRCGVAITRGMPGDLITVKI